jgi:hypothetical protein
LAIAHVQPLLPDFVVLPVALTLYFAFAWVLFIIDQLPDYLPTLWQMVAGCAIVLLLGSALQTVASRTVRPAGRWRLRCTATALLGLGLFLTVGIAIPGIMANWHALTQRRVFSLDGYAEAERRNQSRHNLKGVGLAVHNYHDTFRHLPAGGTFDELGQPMHSWATGLLPYLNQTPLYNQVSRGLPWIAPENRAIFQTPVQAFVLPNPARRPGFTTDGYAAADYAANEYVIGPGPRLTFGDITDGMSNTILAGAVVSRPRAWGDPLNWRDPGLGINTSSEGFGSPWRRDGCQFLFGDGSVTALSENTDPALLRKLATPHGGERITDDDIPRPKIQ